MAYTAKQHLDREASQELGVRPVEIVCTKELVGCGEVASFVGRQRGRKTTVPAANNNDERGQGCSHSILGTVGPLHIAHQTSPVIHKSKLWGPNFALTVLRSHLCDLLAFPAPPDHPLQVMGIPGARKPTIPLCVCWSLKNHILLPRSTFCEFAMQMQISTCTFEDIEAAPSGTAANDSHQMEKWDEDAPQRSAYSLESTLKRQRVVWA